MDVTRLGGGLVAATLSVGLAACGSSSTPTSSGTGAGTLPRAALISRVNAICASAAAQAKAVPPPASVRDPVVAAAYFDKVTPIADKEIQDLAALKPASDVKAQYAAFTAAVQAGDTLLQTIKQKAHSKDSSAVQDIRQLPVSARKVDDAANTLGATTCSSH